MTDRNGRGIIYAILAFFSWGVLPLYWKLLNEVPALEILAHRIFWSFIFTLLILFIQKRLRLALLLKDRKTLSTLCLTSLLIGINWFIYIVAVNSNRIVDASMGYYINPLVSIFLGLFILKERLRPLQIIAFVSAIAGVAYFTIDYGRVPWIALVLAFSFAFYGLLKKTSHLESLPSLMVETMFLSPFAVGFILYQAAAGRGAFLTKSIAIDLLLLGAGVVTTLPLYWFAQAAKRIPLSSIGFLQYLGPSLMLIIGVVLYNEPFTLTHMISFSLIWIGVVLYSVTLIQNIKSSPIR